MILSMSGRPTKKKIPLFDVKLASATRREVTDTLKSGWLTSGPKVKRFESKMTAQSSKIGQPEVLWSTYPPRKLIHQEQLEQTCAGVVQHVMVSGVGETYWRNSDRSIRDWWRANQSKVKSEHLLLLEWDALCTSLEFEFPILGMGVSATKDRDTDKDWYWWHEVDKLPPDLRAHAIGVAPLGAILFHRNALDWMAEPRFDEVYKSDVMCEVRTPTVIRSGGFVVEGIAELRNCIWGYPEVDLAVPGIWHRVVEATSTTNK